MFLKSLKRNINMDSSLYESSKSKPSHLLPRIIDGGIGGFLGVTFIYPVDLAKTRLQNQRALGSNNVYKGLFDCFQKTYKAEGFLKMYRGYPVNAALMAPETAVKMVANDIFRWKLSKDDGSITMMSEVIAGGCAGICQSSISTPMELIKIQLQDYGRTQTTSQTSSTGVPGLKTTSFQVAKNIVVGGGVFSLYKGGWPTVMRNIAFAMIYFPLFANLNKLGPQSKYGESVFWWSLAMGWVSASVSAALTTPMDVVKTRMQTLNKGVGEETYKGVFDAFYRILRSEGPTALFKGMGCRIIVIGPLFGISQMVYFLDITGSILGIDRH